jgi:hypothetical protein
LAYLVLSALEEQVVEQPEVAVEVVKVMQLEKEAAQLGLEEMVLGRR